MFLSFLPHLIGCAAPELGMDAPYYAAVEAPEQINLSWNHSINDLEDGLGLMLMYDVLVYNTNDNVPMANIQVELTSGAQGIYIIPKEAVYYVPFPAEVDESECFDEEGNPLVDAPDNCAWWADTSTNQYYQFSAEYADAYAPSYMIGSTNERGLLEVYLYVDAMPVDGEEFQNVFITADIGVSGDQTLITTESN